MSIYRCGWCGAPSLKVRGLCNPDAARLEDLLGRCQGMHRDLMDAAAGGGRYGEVSARSTAPGLPIRVEAVEARRELEECLNLAVCRVRGRTPVLDADTASAFLLRHFRRVRESWAGTVLLGDLLAVVPRAVAAVDIPRSRITLQVPCPHCGGRPLRPVGGALECVSCGKRASVAEVRA